MKNILDAQRRFLSTTGFPFFTRARPPRRRRFLTKWYQWTALPEAEPHADLTDKERVRQSHLNSVIILLLFIFVLAAIPSILFTASYILLPTCAIVFLCLGLGLVWNHQGRVLLTGALTFCIIECGIILVVYTAPGGLEPRNLPVLDLFVLPEILAVALLPARSVFYIAPLHGVLIWGALVRPPQPIALVKLLTISPLFMLLCVPFLLQFIVGGIAYLWATGMNEAIKRADRADELDQLVQQQHLLLEEVHRLYREQAKAAETDPITGLPNHRAVMQRVRETVTSCQQTQEHCALLFLDLDHFKRINDTWGHRVGDAVLVETGRRLQRVLREDDLVGRYGGEEFVILLPGATLHQAIELAERVRYSLTGMPYQWCGDEGETVRDLSVTASIGIATYPLHGACPDTLIESADQAMYQAKQTGRNKCCVAPATHAEQRYTSRAI